ncbi:MAG: hypothetical protein B0D96_00265 [Candidatus Sedimenticola endophacoides]|nr:MAG: hypothetical protein B0D94_01245 [Candidatus Sedimenticola endophacoides]OQX38404.1 MAG: hypothetical protein B0D96_00265 [Candidatus Sedimenticola endophacoides]
MHTCQGALGMAAQLREKAWYPGEITAALAGGGGLTPWRGLLEQLTGRGAFEQQQQLQQALTAMESEAKAVSPR